VLIVGDRIKKDVIRADRADGFYLRNVMTQEGAFNNVDVVETNGFRLSKLETRWGQNYGVLTFASDNGVYDTIEATATATPGSTPGSGPEGQCKRFGIEIRDVVSYGNILGYSAPPQRHLTHDSKFYDNARASPTTPSPRATRVCHRLLEVVEQRDPLQQRTTSTTTRTRPTATRPVREAPARGGLPAVPGAGRVGDHPLRRQPQPHREQQDLRQLALGDPALYVPASIRGENEPEKQLDTSNGNQFRNNAMGIGPDGKAAPNGEDFFWDEQGIGNCWQGNSRPPTGSSRAIPPGCRTARAGGSRSTASNPRKSARRSPAPRGSQGEPDPPGAPGQTPAKPK
jgi:hypothetical protein